MGEVVGQIPEVKNGMLGALNDLPDWFSYLINFHFLLSPDGQVSYVRIEKDDEFRLNPILVDLKGEPVFVLIKLVGTHVPSSLSSISMYLQKATDWASVLKRYSGCLSQALTTTSDYECEKMLDWLSNPDYDYGPILPVLVQLATGSNRKIRDLSIRLLQRTSQGAHDLLAAELSRDTAAHRGHAVRALVAVCGAQAEPDLVAALKTEKAVRVRQNIESCLSRLQDKDVVDEPQAAPAVVYDLPLIDMPSGELPLPKGFVDQLWEQLQTVADEMDEQYERRLQAYQILGSEKHLSWKRGLTKPRRINIEQLKWLIDYMEGKITQKPYLSSYKKFVSVFPPWSEWTDPGVLHLLHVVRFMDAFGLIDPDVCHIKEEWIKAHRDAQTKPYGLREVEAAFATLPNFKSGLLTELLLHSGYFSSWEDEAVWPLLAEYRDKLRDTILGVNGGLDDLLISIRRCAAMGMAAKMPSLPPDIENAIWSGVHSTFVEPGKSIL